ncbi:MAG: HIT domain-containing protein [Candidatus Aenigmarchaeota archaeon]|nr:HIT domain-containing protein [Candidatus Aenigmarchaeota archaeon]
MPEGCKLCRELEEGDMVVYRDDYCFCIFAKWPIKEGHLMVLPVRHVGDVSDLTEKESKAMFGCIGLFQKVLPELYGAHAMVIQNPVQKRTEEHLHYHILPSTGGIRDLFTNFEKTPYRVDVPREEMGRTAEHIRSALGKYLKD